MQVILFYKIYCTVVNTDNLLIYKQDVSLAYALKIHKNQEVFSTDQNREFNQDCYLQIEVHNLGNSQIKKKYEEKLKELKKE